MTKKTNKKPLPSLAQAFNTNSVTNMASTFGAAAASAFHPKRNQHGVIENQDKPSLQSQYGLLVTILKGHDKIKPIDRK